MITASRTLITATQATSDKNTVVSVAVDVATGWNLALIRSSSRCAAALLSSARDPCRPAQTRRPTVLLTYHHRHDSSLLLLLLPLPTRNETTTATRSCRTRKHAVHVYSPGVAAKRHVWPALLLCCRSNSTAAAAANAAASGPWQCTD